MDLEAVAEGLATAASAIEGLRCFPYTPDSFAAPAFYVGEITQTYDESFGRGMDSLTVICRVMVERTNERAAQKALNGYLSGSGPNSIKAALEAASGAPGESALPSDLAPDGCCDDFHVQRVAGHRLYTVGTTTYLGAEYTVLVIGPGES
ncbi:MAG TPA: hypothetical protein VHA75_15855 [Rugosimonospora sp.]|nr:hypothetical protein [Rugosimonospora sp.]